VQVLADCRRLWTTDAPFSALVIMLGMRANVSHGGGCSWLSIPQFRVGAFCRNFVPLAFSFLSNLDRSDLRAFLLT